MTPQKILIMAAGTGGHIFPALTIARHLQSRGVLVEWLGTPGGMENDVLRDTDIKLNRLSVSGLRGKGRLALVKAPFMLLRSVWQAIVLLRSIDPCCVLGMGGYVTGPGGLAAFLLGKPLVIHEQNAIAGTSNRLLKPLARRVLEAFPGTFPASDRVINTGNPVRSDIAVMAAHKQTNESAPFSGERALRLLVLGGSLGAAAINLIVPELLKDKTLAIDVYHQTGKDKFEDTLASYVKAGIDVSTRHKVVPFITDMAQAYGWADIVLCRAGAGTLAEIAVAGLPSLLVPYPYAIDDHQTANARWLADAGAAALLPQNKLTVDLLKETLNGLINSPAQLRAMATAAGFNAVPDAGEKVSAICLETCHD
ncbi:undecaprenyldiphospho-muramoylpentapeptide beta-N-acetylglucosaminyltransferase [Gammaproteobacteria bacterium LSUCC0112]|nr:undecaprenyldiphospho-muramoylpentapeptide beta-N-acetylglucosaminyltransferase [Gammaproteobacteria bacterium LSUCC0112]